MTESGLNWSSDYPECSEINSTEIEFIRASTRRVSVSFPGAFEGVSRKRWISVTFFLLRQPHGRNMERGGGGLIQSMCPSCQKRESSEHLLNLRISVCVSHIHSPIHPSLPAPVSRMAGKHRKIIKRCWRKKNKSALIHRWIKRWIDNGEIGYTDILTPK